MGFVVYDRILRMATEVYKTDYIYLINGEEIEISPLKIKYLRQFMNTFIDIEKAKDDDEAIEILTECAKICMKQYYPEISKTVDEYLDLQSLYKIVDVGANIKINEASQETVKKQATDSGSNWDNLDLAKLESEVFVIGIWKDYDELEKSLSIPELFLTLQSKRELDYDERKFFAAIQGIDLDKETGKSRGQKEWEDLKARVFSKGKVTDSNDVLALQGQNAVNAGFGIGMGLEYEDLTKIT